MITITSLRHAYPEHAGFRLERKYGHKNYTFLHFFNSVDLLVNDTVIHTEPHACLIYPIAQPQYFTSSIPLTHDWIHFYGDDTFPEHMRNLGIEPNVLYYPNQPEFITKLTREMEMEFFSNRAKCKELLSLKMDELFIRLYRAVSGETYSTLSQDVISRLKDLRGEIFLSLDHGWTVAEMAKKMTLSESRFFYAYKSLFGISPIEDLISTRINTAKNYLSLGNETISAISEKLGYNNLTHFIRQFKSATGVTPSTYRNNHT